MKGSDPVDCVCVALASKYLIQVAHSLRSTMSSEAQRQGKAPVRSYRLVDLTQAREVWYELVDERLMGSWVPSTLRICTGCWIVRSRSPTYWQRKLDEVKKRSGERTTTKWKKAEENGSLAKCVEVCCAKVPKGNVCPVCLALKQRIRDKKVGSQAVQFHAEEMSARDLHRIAQQRTLLLGCVVQDD